MLTLRPAHQRGHMDHGWLRTWHTFSFARYHDPAHMGWRDLRVINEDIVAPATGFGEHPHQDMEIVTWILSGALAHRDSMGHAGVIRPGEVQRMSAGTGILHSEMNPDPDEPVHLLQIWLHPDRAGHAPSYEQAAVDDAGVRNRWGVIAAREGGAVTWHQDSRLLIARLDAGAELPLTAAPERHLWLQVARGAVSVDGRELAAGDGARASGPLESVVRAQEESELLLFDLV